MKLYQTVDGTLIGFYQEMGGAVQALLYRDIYEWQLVDKERQEEVTIPGYYEYFDIVTPGYWHEESVYVNAHYERQMVWHPAHDVTRYREIAGHYERQNIWVPAYYVTRYYWREAHPARGLEAAWIPYEHLIEAGYKLQRVWVDTLTEKYIETIPAGERETRVYVPGDYVTEKTWIEETIRVQRVWIEPEITYETVEYQEFEDVWVGREPVYEYIDPVFVQDWEVLGLDVGAGHWPDYEDIITIRNTNTGEELTTSARYMGLAERIDDNEYVVP